MPDPWINEITVLSNRDVHYFIFCRWDYCDWWSNTGPQVGPEFELEPLVEAAKQMEQDHCAISHPRVESSPPTMGQA